MVVAFTTLPFVASAQPGSAGHRTAPGQQVTPAGSQPSVLGSAENFTGQARVEPLFGPTPELPAAGAYVTFEAGARSAWHSHPAGQRLVVVAGVGRTQEWGQPVREIRPGDVVVCPPGVKHWHGAAPTSSMTHFTLSGILDSKSVEWMEKVSDAEYHENPRREAPETAVVLTEKEQAIPLIGAAMAAGDMPVLNRALSDGLDASLTIAELKEILIQLYAYAGFPRSLNALSELIRVLETRKARGIVDAPGREPSMRAPTGQQLLELGKANQTKISGAPVGGPVMEFAPAINQFLQAHLFGDIFVRDNLGWQARELATLGALSAMPGLEAQLLSHMKAGMRVGLTEPQLRHLTRLLTDMGHTDAASRAKNALELALQTSVPQPSVPEPRR